jgi:hypothetical protein
MCLTRPDITEIVWPTKKEMAATAAAYEEGREVMRRRAAAVTARIAAREEMLTLDRHDVPT